MTDDILETIDGALSDYAMSTDAMRWTPQLLAQPNGTLSVITAIISVWITIQGRYGWFNVTENAPEHGARVVRSYDYGPFLPPALSARTEEN